MTVFQLVILPGILLALFLTGLFFLAARAACAWIRLARARETAALTPSRLLSEQTLIIQDVIAELQVNPSSSLPDDLKNRLIDTYAKSRKELR
jgi:hypothetical protein